jgi:hypothetical protein
MDKVEKSISSVMFSCTRNVIIAVAGVYLLYLIYGVLDNNSDSIFSAFAFVFSHIGSFFAPIKSFLIEHLGKFFIGWIISILWIICVIVKLESNSIAIPNFFNLFAALLVPVGCILFFMAACKLDSGLGLLSGIIAFIFLLFSIGIMGALLFDDEAAVVKTDNAPVQLELFDKK